jgi:hypothetical protein
MYRNYFFGIIMLFTSIASAQNNDLIVTTKGDSIACDIVKVTDSEVIFNMIYNSRKVQTINKKTEISDIKYDVVRKRMFKYKPGTSYIIGQNFPFINDAQYNNITKPYSLEYLQNASNEEMQYYLYKAQRLKKTGKTVTITGVLIFGTSVLIGILENSWSGLAIIAIGGMTGSLVSLVGLPILITGASRVKRINELERNSLSGLNINLAPAIHYNQYTQNYQSGLTLSIRF